MSFLGDMMGGSDDTPNDEATTDTGADTPASAEEAAPAADMPEAAPEMPATEEGAGGDMPAEEEPAA